MEHVTPDKPEVHEMADILGIDPDAVVGKLLRLWIWCDQQTLDGNAISVTKHVIDRITYAPGFSAALLKVDWLLARSGSLAIPHFDRHNGQSAKKRADANRRVSKHRAGKIGNCNAESVTKPLPKALPEKRREEKRVRGDTTYLLSDESDVHAPYLDFWEAYPQPGRKRSSREKVKKAWQAVKPPTDTLILLEKWKSDPEWKKDGGQYVPAADRWLREKRWQDPPSEEPAQSPRCAAGTEKKPEDYVNINNTNDDHF